MLPLIRSCRFKHSLKKKTQQKAIQSKPRHFDSKRVWIVSKMSTMKFSRRPPLAKSPVRTRPRRIVRSTSVQTPPGSLTKSAAPLRRWDVEEIYDFRPEIGPTSFELRALARMARGNIESEDETTGLSSYSAGANKSPLFERRRFYDVYSAKRNERLKRKLGLEMDDVSFKKHGCKCDLVATIGTKRQSNRLQSGRKSIAVDFLVDKNQTQNSRYSLRSSTKENKKPPLSMSFDKSYGIDAGVKSVSTRRVVRKI